MGAFIKTPPINVTDVSAFGWKEWFRSVWRWIKGISKVSSTSTSSFTPNESFFYPADATSAAITVTLPLAASYPYKTYYIKKIDSSANTVTVSSSGSDTIDGATSKVLTGQYDGITLLSDGSATWWILNPTWGSTTFNIDSAQAASDTIGISVYTQGADAAAATHQAISAEGYSPASNGNNLSLVYGVNGAGSSYTGSGKTVTDVVGVVGQAALFAAGNVTDADAFLGRARNEGAGTITNAVGLKVLASTNSGGGAITNVYGILLEGQTVGTNNYGIVSGAGDNYLGDSLTWVPPASITPSNNGDLTFEATSNTSLTIKYKGSDGTVRTVALTLA